MNNTLTNRNPAGRILLASMVGTTIEFFDFYIYATAAVLVFPKLFFPEADPTSATLQSLATFALAFFARPLGAALFGHFGDRKGRKATLVAALMTMGPSTVAIGLLPTYQSIGVAAPILLALFRFGQGLGLGGEWGGAVLLATENAPPGKKAWYGMFPQLGAPLGFIISSGTFFILGKTLTDQQFFRYGWRIPFIASAVLVWVGLYVRLKITETPDFLKVIEKNERVKVPVAEVFVRHTRAIVLGTAASITTFLLFYLMTVFALSWGVSALHYSKTSFLVAQIISMLFFSLGIPLSAVLADRYGRGGILMLATAAHFCFRIVFFSPVCRRQPDHDQHLPGHGHVPDGANLWPAGHGAGRNLSTRRTLYGILDGLYAGGHHWRFADALPGHHAGEKLWTIRRRLLSGHCRRDYLRSPGGRTIVDAGKMTGWLLN